MRKFIGLFFVLSGLLAVSSLRAEAVVKAVNQQPWGLSVTLTTGRLDLRPLADNAIRAQFANGEVPQRPSYFLTEKIATPKFAVSESANEIIIKTDKMQAVLDRSNGALRFEDATGKVLLAEKPGARMATPSKVRGRPTLAVSDAFVSPPDEHLFGTGQFQDGSLDIRDLPRRLVQINTQISIPMLVSSKGYGLLWHNYGIVELNPADQKIDLKPLAASAGELHGSFTTDKAGDMAFFFDEGKTKGSLWNVQIDGKSCVNYRNIQMPGFTGWRTHLGAGTHQVVVKANANEHPTLFFRPSKNETVLRSAVADALDYVVFAGNADEVIATYRELTGAAPLMPIWAYGYIHCRERFHSQQELLDAAAEFRKRQIPIDVIVQDWQYWGKYGWNAMQFDERNYPDPAAMIQKLHAEHLRLMLSVWSKIDTQTELGKELSAKKFYIPGTTWVDFFNPAAAAFYWQNMDQRLLSLGIDAWWLDATEPEDDALVGRETFLGAGEKVRDIYPLFVTSTVYNGQRAAAPDQRVCILTRSATAGEQRNAAAVWSGDIGSNWEALRRQIPAGLDFVVSGLPYWTTDCGGFWRPANQYTDPAYHELFLRWFQYATFCPLQRVHGYGSKTEFWNYGDAVEKEARRYLNFRYRLLPYIYSQAAQVTFHGSTLMRPLVMDFANDERALEQKYEFMFGPALLVSPVLQPHVNRWNVYLPKTKGGWFDFWTGKKQNGGQTIQADAPLEKIPLYVRAGSIIPLGAVEQYTQQKPAHPIELRIYTGANGAFTLYEDEGVNYDYEKGKYTNIHFSWNDQTQKLTISGREGSFPGMLQKRTFRIVWVTPSHGVGIDPAQQADTEISYTGKAITISK